MHHRFILVLRYCLLFLIVAGTTLPPQSAAYALTTLTVESLTWNIMGLDSNDVNVGPNHFPVGARVCNSGSEAATNVTAAFQWDSSDPYIALRPGTLTSINLGTLNAGSCADAYFEVQVTRNAGAYDHTRDYHINVTAGNVSGTISTPTPRQVYVEHLVSQSRNAVTDLQLNGVSVAEGGTMTLMVGQTYEIKLVGFTATQGYEQIEYFINFPNTIFQILSVSSTFTADTSPTVGPSPIDMLYGDNCVWDNDPDSPTYRACLSTGKTGGNITTTYQVRILQMPGAPLVNPQPLSTLIYDFSGSSYHYNSDYGFSTRYANIVNAGITKSFSPKTINPGSTSTLTFTINNPGTSAMTGVSFTDDLPAGMTLVNNSVTYSGCGAALPATVSDPLSFSNITVAGLGTCTVAVSVTASTDGTYNNTSGNLFINTSTDTGSFATDSLVVSSRPTPPASCASPVTLASWTLPTSGQGSGGPPPPYTTKATDVSTATASAVLTATGSQSTNTAGPTTNAWGITDAWPSVAGAPGATAAPYFDFVVDTSNYGGLQITFDRDLEAPGDWGNATNSVYVYSSADGGAFSTATAIATTKGSWQTGATATTATTGSSTTRFTIHADTRNAAKATSTVYLDNIVITGCQRPSAPTLSKSFSPTTIPTGSASTLTFTFTNPNSTALSEISFSDTLPTGLAVNTPNGLSAISCSAGSVVTAPAITATAGTSTISMNGLQLSANASCSFSVSVKGNASGAYTNISQSITSTSSGPNTTSGGYGTSSLTVIDPPVFAKSFTANPIFTGSTTALDFDIVNPNASTALAGVTFGDVLPAGLSVADGTFSVCGGTNNLTTTAATRTITLLNTTTIAAGATCSFSVTVTGSSAGSYTNTTGNISSTNGGIGNTASANVLVKTPAPAINLLKQSGPTVTGPWTSFMSISAGSNVFYRFTVENTGDFLLSNVSVDDPTVSTIACSWTRGDGTTPVTSPFTLPVADAVNNHIATCVLGPIIAISGSHTNTATASGTSGSTVTKSSSATYGTPAITIAKSVTETSFTAVGDVLNYSYLVTNSGEAPLLGPVTVTDDRATVTCPAVSTVGDNDAWLDQDESLTCTASYTVQAGDVTAGFVTNTASASVGGITSNTDSETVNVTTLTDLSLDKQVSNSTPIIGSTVTFTLVLSNAGPSTATNIVVTDVVPSGYTYDPASIDGGTSQNDASPAGTGLSWTINSLASGASTNLTYQATVLDTGAYDNYAEITSQTETDSDSTAGNGQQTPDEDDDDTQTVTPLADLTISKTNNVASGSVVSGSAFQWTITVRNGAASGTASFVNGDVILSDALPAGQTYAAVTLTLGAPAPTGTIDCSITGTTLSCVANGPVTLPADASFAVALNVTTTGSADLVNTATVDPDANVPESNETNNTGSNTVYVFDGQPSKLLVTTSEPSTNAARVVIGEVVRYRIAARIPEGDFADFQLVDNIPNGLQFLNDGTARFAFVSNGGGVTSSTLACANDTGNAFDLASLPSANVDCALTGAISGGTGNGIAVTFSLGNLSNADVDADAEYALVEFNALVLNVTSAATPTINQGTNNQTGANVVNNRQNDVTLRVNNATVGINSANVTVNIAEPAITNVTKSVSAGPYLPGDTVTYTLTFSNVSSSNTNAATAFDILLSDSLDANLTPGTVNISSTQAAACQGGTAFAASSSTTGQNVTVNVSCLDPDASVTVTIGATINAATADGTTISNTGVVTYTSLPGVQGSCSVSPFTCAGVGGSGSKTGERNGSGGAGLDTTVLNNYSDSGTASITVTVIDLLPLAAPDTNIATENGPAANGNVLTNENSLGDTPTTVTGVVDDDGDALIIGAPFTTDAGGTLTINANGTYTYTPPATLPEGGALTEVFTYAITDVDGDSDTTTLSFTVDRLPEASPDTNTATEGGTDATGNVITNDDEGNVNATVTGADQGGTAITISTPFTTAAGGSLTLNADGTYTYAPPATLPEGAVLTEVFNYTITDADGDTNSSTLTITVDRLPEANPDTDTATEGGPDATGNVLTNDDEGDTNATVTTVVDDDGDTVAVGAPFTTDAGGTLTLNTNGSYTYTPPALGTVPAGGITEVFTYTITDADGDTSMTTLTITVDDTDRLPDAVADTNTATENGPAVNGNVLTNENSLGDTPTTVTGVVDDDGDALTPGTPFATDGGGTLTINADGTYTYTPPAINLVPPGGLVEVFAYTITDVDGDTSTTTLTITVDDSDQLPVATDNSYTINDGETATGNAMTDGTPDTPGDPPTTVTSYDATSVNGGTVTVAPDGSFTYDPNGYVGTDTFTYTITDDDGDTSTATVTITVHQSLIGVAKRVVSTTEVSPGTYDVTYDIYIENFGTTVLDNIQVTDDLSATFPAPTTFTIRSLSSGDFTVNPGYNGNTDIDLLDGSDNLAVGANGTITLVVRVVPSSSGPFNNTAMASGQCPTCNTPVTDDSQDGSDPDPDNDDDPTNDNDPTPLTFGPNLFDPPFGLKVVDATGLPVLQWTMVWINDSNIVAIDAEVSDPISAGTAYAGGLTCVASGVTTTNLCTYEAPSGSYPRGRVVWNGNLGPDLGATNAANAFNEITITFNVNVDTGITSVQNTATIDADLNGDNDLTDAGEQIVASASSNWTATPTSSGDRTLPSTGFAPNVVTDMSNVPQQAYTATGEVIVEIRSLNVKIPVVGIPKKDGTWNVSWLGNQAGWLEGSAFPSWKGNSVLTSHVYLSNGLPGPFVNLGTLKYGDKILIHAYGQTYTFEVRENKIVEPNDLSVMKHEEKAWLTLVTCKEYDPKTNTYRKRVVIRAVLVSVTR